MGDADFCQFALGVPMPSMAPRPGGEGRGLRVEATISMVSILTELPWSCLSFLRSPSALGKWARILVQKVLYTLGLDYRHGSVAGWSKAIAPAEATGLI